MRIRTISTSAAITGALFAVPFLLGMFIALRLRGDYQPDGVRTAPFLLFVAVSAAALLVSRRVRRFAREHGHDGV